ncbi:hypothetical protein KAFR_0A03010 [Kazachstania africana CBS 2517]|uniref:VPS9 domain-containing protein n=1 Tax=Kazachstania africana (strain ATCC 22294 / BCRC 22015 / CBS 2517 / CECT 1963 / NBRC 1671 / NRRL Y-8276) TaxID=1071382 RepID=H2AMY6_KAZAF|nr:hypothetical protein KAFR_0A03010 [Kazachstania africana CBS 2517]CCF55736.1 hypothetical protein KAFR_0A03010 [Kazachstania africana CBS 2517]
MVDTKDILKEFDPLTQEDNERKDDLGEVQRDSETVSTENSNERSSSNSRNERTYEDDQFFDFRLFAKQFRNPQADPLVKYTKSFLHNFATQRAVWTPEEQVKLINDFRLFIFGKLKVYEPFKSLDKAGLHNAEEGIEKLIMGKLYTRCFSPTLIENVNEDTVDKYHLKDIEDDELLIAKVKEYRFIELSNLDIPNKLYTRLDKFVELAGKELNKVNGFKAPRDKMVCILNSCRVIFGLLKHHRLDKEGADSFIPLLIFIILKGDIANLVSNIRYIERFRYEKFLRGEESYYLSSYQAAYNFILSMDETSLTVADNNEFDRKYKENQKLLMEEKEQKDRENAQLKQSSKEAVSSGATSKNSLDEVTNSMISMFNDLFTSSQQKPEEMGDQNKRNKKDEDVTQLINRMEEQEHKDTVDTLCSMFPDFDREIIEDVCVAKKYRIGVCVDTLLSLYN